MSKTIPEAAYRVLDDVNFAHVVTLLPDGMPQTTPVWIDRQDGVPIFNTAKGRVKHANLVRDPRVAFSVHDHTNPYVYLQVRGHAEIVDDPDKASIEALSQKYMGGPYPFHREGEERVIVRVIPSDVVWLDPNAQ